MSWDNLHNLIIPALLLLSRVYFSQMNSNTDTLNSERTRALYRVAFLLLEKLLFLPILFVDWNNDTSLPNLTTCKERAGIEGVVTHDALEDAWDVVQVLRKFY